MHWNFSDIVRNLICVTAEAPLEAEQTEAWTSQARSSWASQHVRGFIQLAQEGVLLYGQIYWGRLWGEGSALGSQQAMIRG